MTSLMPTKIRNENLVLVFTEKQKDSEVLPISEEDLADYLDDQSCLSEESEEQQPHERKYRFEEIILPRIRVLSKEEEREIFIRLEQAHIKCAKAFAEIPEWYDLLCDLLSDNLDNHYINPYINISRTCMWRRTTLFGQKCKPEDVAADAYKIYRYWRGLKLFQAEQAVITDASRALATGFIYKTQTLQKMRNILRNHSSDCPEENERYQRALSSLGTIESIENKIASHNYGMVKSILHRKHYAISLCAHKATWGDFFQHAYMKGLREAIESYSYQTGYAFSTIGYIHVKGAVSRMLTQLLPGSYWGRASEMPASDCVGRHSTRSVKTFLENNAIADEILEHNFENIEDLLFYLEFLTEKEKKVLQRHYLDEVPVEKLANEMHLTTQAIYDLKNKALRKIKKILRQQQDCAYDFEPV